MVNDNQYDAHVKAFYDYWYTCPDCGAPDDFYGPTCQCEGNTLQVFYLIDGEWIEQ